MKYTETDGEEYDWPNDTVIDGLKFEMTCSGCPEQYDVWDNSKICAYVRLRWGCLRAYYPDVGGECIYSAEIGDGAWTGCFESEEQRMEHLTKIAKIVKRCAEAQGGHC